MPRRTLALGPVVAAVGLWSGSALADDNAARKSGRGQAWEQEEFEDKAIAKAAERAIKAADTEAGRWQKEMTRSFPGKAAPAATEEDLAAWFTLLAPDGRRWSRDACPNRQVAELFDRVTQKLELGPVPSLQRDEFLQFAKRHLIQKNPQQPKPGERFAEADRVFRVLDRDGSGVLEAAEWTERMRSDREADADGNRKIDPEEFRAYFERRTAEATEALKRAGTAAKSDAPGIGLPAWWKDLDTDGDGQIGLYEWRAAGRPTAEFMKMDLDGDGLLPPDEYRRFVQMAAKQPPPELESPGTTAPGDRPRMNK